MTSAIRPTDPLKHLSFCTLLGQREFFEIIVRVNQAVVNVFINLAEMIIDTLVCILKCGNTSRPRTITRQRPPVSFRVEDMRANPTTRTNTFSAQAKPSRLRKPTVVGNNRADPAVLSPVCQQKLEKYRQLPLASPAFENAAVKLTLNWLSKNDVQEMAEFDGPGMERFARIITRASVFTGRTPVYSDNPVGMPARQRVQFESDCEALYKRFNKLSNEDQIAILDHFDSEVTAIKEGENITGYYLTPLPQDPNNPRPLTLTPSQISTEATIWWDDCGKVITGGYQNSHHPIMQNMGKVTWPKV